MTAEPPTNRYLRLDGSPVEHSQLQRLFPTGTLCATFLATLASDAHFQMDPGDLITPALGTIQGMLRRRLFQFCGNLMWDVSFHDHVIDTQPTPHTRHNPPSSYALRAGFNCIMMLGAPLVAFNLANPNDLPRMLPYWGPSLISGTQQVLTYNKIRSGRWKIIKRSDMEREEQHLEQARNPHLAAAPTA